MTDFGARTCRKFLLNSKGVGRVFKRHFNRLFHVEHRSNCSKWNASKQPSPMGPAPKGSRIRKLVLGRFICKLRSCAFERLGRGARDRCSMWNTSALLSMALPRGFSTRQVGLASGPLRPCFPSVVRLPIRKPGVVRRPPRLAHYSKTTHRASNSLRPH